MSRRRPQEQSRPRPQFQPEFRQLPPGPVGEALREIQDNIYKLRGRSPLLRKPEDERKIDINESWETNKLFPPPSVATYTNLNFQEEWGFVVPFTEVTGASGSLTVNMLIVLPFQLNGTITIDRITVQINTAAASSHYSVGIYDSTKTLTNAYYKFDSSTTGIKTQTPASSTTLAAGFYWLGHTTDNASVQFNLAFNSSPAAVHNFINNSVTIMGTAGATSSGDLPSSFTTITDAAVHTPAVRFFVSTMGG